MGFFFYHILFYDKIGFVVSSHTKIRGNKYIYFFVVEKMPSKGKQCFREFNYCFMQEWESNLVAIDADEIVSVLRGKEHGQIVNDAINIAVSHIDLLQRIISGSAGCLESSIKEFVKVWHRYNAKQKLV